MVFQILAVGLRRRQSEEKTRAEIEPRGRGLCPLS